MTRPEPSTTQVFAQRAELWHDAAPLFAALCRAVAEEPGLAAAVVHEPGHHPEGTTAWSRPHLLMALVTRLLRTGGAGAELAAYWPTLGGSRAVDDRLPRLFGDFVGEHHDALVAAVRRFPGSRSNNPAQAAFLWPGIAWAVDRIAGPVGLLELGAAAGLCLYLDRFGYRYGDTVIRGDSPLVVDGGLIGEPPDFLDVKPDVAVRIGLERAPIRREDTEAVGWLRDCVLPDHADLLADMDSALSLLPVGGIDWREGDFMTRLPEALAAVPEHVTPIVYGAHVLCCVDRPERLPEILADSGRDLVWIADEHADNALELVSDVADEYLTEPPTVLLTAVTYRAGRPVEAHVLAEPDLLARTLTWAPRAATPR